MTRSSLHSSGPISNFRKPANSDNNSGAATIHSLAVLLFMLLCTYAVTAAAQGNGGMGGPHKGTVKIACNKCHILGQWKPIKSAPDFDHGSTGFSLKGRHAGIYCRVCHSSLVFSEIGNQCSDCHADIHRRQLGEDCEDCHSVRDWEEIRATVDGHRNRFPLLGAHAALQCESCHTGAAVGLFRGLRTDCDACHHSDYVAAGTIDHQTAGFSLQCELCHSMDSWSSGFDHTAITGFDLTGAHAALDCVDCHTNSNFSGARADCAGCHLEDYNATTVPNHVSGNYPLDCALCHSTVSWVDFSAFDHNQTQYPLTGAHVTVACQDCHLNGQYSGLSTDCYACHASVFDNATNPSHVAAGFSHDCLQCHTTSSWLGVVYDHSNTQFPLTGGHSGLQCQDCHASGQYAGLSTDCYACHADVYNTWTDPNHAAAGFSHDCLQCHTTSNWTNTTYSHDAFPIYSGRHANTWSVCSICHTNSDNYSVFTCFPCHSKAAMDSGHREVSGYVYNNASCYSCHSGGGEGD